MYSLNDDTSYETVTSNLVGGGTVEFDVPWTEHADTPETNPVQFWLEIMPTAQETDPD